MFQKTSDKKKRLMETIEIRQAAPRILKKSFEQERSNYYSREESDKWRTFKTQEGQFQNTFQLSVP